MILLPRITKPNSGMFRNAKGVWYTHWKEDGRPVQRTTGTKDVFEARRVRDARHRALLDRGAVVTGSASHLEHGDRYIYERPAYIVRVPGHPQAECGTLTEAREKRNELLKK